MTIHQADDHRQLLLALAQAEPLTENEARLLAILLDPRNDPSPKPVSNCGRKTNIAETSPTWLIMAWSELTGAVADQAQDVQLVAAFLMEHYYRIERADNSGMYATPFQFTWTTESGNDIVGYEISIDLASTLGCSLMVYRPLSGLRQDLRGIRYALYLAECIDDDYRLLLEKALAHQLLPPLQAEISADELDRMWAREDSVH